VLLRGAGGLGYELPWRHDPGGWFLPAIALLVLVVVMTARFVRSGRGRFTVRGGG
jgi:hypothetical protein